jgi:hypothetical protein
VRELVFSRASCVDFINLCTILPLSTSLQKLELRCTSRRRVRLVAVGGGGDIA